MNTFSILFGTLAVYLIVKGRVGTYAALLSKPVA